MCGRYQKKSVRSAFPRTGDTNKKLSDTGPTKELMLINTRTSSAELGAPSVAVSEKRPYLISVSVISDICDIRYP